MFKRILITSALSVILVACGGSGGGGAPQVSEGVFIDSPVQGLRYVTASQGGMTGADGSFSYVAGETVEFYIGDILIGSVTAKATVTPIDLVPGAVDQTDPTVTNILRFVQSLDDDNNTSNGIEITAEVSMLAVRMTIDFSQSIIDFETDGNVQSAVSILTGMTTTGVRGLIDSGIAQQHLLTSLANLGNTGSAGNSGDFGSVNITGGDTSVIGSSFSPSVVVAIPATQVITATWTASRGETTNIQFSTISMVIIGDSLSRMAMVHGFSGETAYSYSVNCQLQPIDCAGISIDLDAKSVTMTNAIIDRVVTIDNSATGAITMNGTLTWE